MTAPSTSSTTRRPPSPLRAGGTAVVVAGASTALTHLLFGALGADFVVTPAGQGEPMAVPVGLAVGAAVLATTGGVALVAVLARRAPRRAVRVVVAATAAVLALAAVNPVLSADQVLTVVALEVEHLLVAGAFLAFVLPALRPAPAPRRT